MLLVVWMPGVGLAALFRLMQMERAEALRLERLD
jgi:hypothetical protein